MENSNIAKRNLKAFVSVSIVTGCFIVLFSLIGHLLTPGKLIPASFIGGTLGVILGTLFCFKKNFINKENLLPVLLCNLFAFGLVSFIIVFNFDKPLLILTCFLLFGLTTIITNHYFSNQTNFSTKRFLAIMGILLSFPALYFVGASILKFQLDYSFLFSPIETLLSKPNGQTNFNAITPFLFGGGLLLSFGLNLFTQLKFQKTNKNILHYNISGLRVSLFNLVVLLIAGFVGLTIIAYLTLENFM